MTEAESTRAGARDDYYFKISSDRTNVAAPVSRR